MIFFVRLGDLLAIAERLSHFAKNGELRPLSEIHEDERKMIQLVSERRPYVLIPGNSNAFLAPGHATLVEAGEVRAGTIAGMERVFPHSGTTLALVFPAEMTNPRSTVSHRPPVF